MKKEILSTRNYGLFKTLVGNRGIGAARVEKIKKSIKEVGYITNPIIVNEKYEVIDGQGRKEALKDLGLPVEYIIHPGAGINECISMNIYGETWKLDDYLNSFVQRGFSDYMILDRLAERHKTISLSMLIPICAGRVTRMGNSITVDEFKTGEYRLGRSVEEAEKICSYIVDMIKAIPVGSKNVVASISAWAFDDKKVDEEKLLAQIKKNPQKVTPFTNTEECIDVLEKVYNTKNRKGYVSLKEAHRKFVSETQKIYAERHKKKVGADK